MMSGKEYILNGKQMQVLKDATSLPNPPKLIHFSGFSLNLNSIDSIDQTQSNAPKLHDGRYKELTEEEHHKLREVIEAKKLQDNIIV